MIGTRCVRVVRMRDEGDGDSLAVEIQTSYWPFGGEASGNYGL